MTKIKNITSYLESFAPLALQESYDNAGLIVGDANAEISALIITLDVTEEVVDEAIRKGAGLIVAHHPIVFSGIKKLTGKNYVERSVIKAIKNDIAIYACHTNLDNVMLGVNGKICEKLGLENCKILDPIKGVLKKLVTFVPENYAEKVRKAVFAVDAGAIGNYDSCSFNAQGEGTFRAGENTNPFVGEKGELHSETEIRIETVFPAYLQGKVINALLQAHPYEEVVYDIYPLENAYNQVGSGMVGVLPQETSEAEFLQKIKDIFNVGTIKHTAFRNKLIKKVALCGGAGAFLLGKAMAQKADVFISGDFKYHEFFNAEGKILIADIGHFESEQYTKELFYELLTKKFPKFAIHLSEVNTNPVIYF